MADREEQHLVEELVAHATIKALDEPVLRQLAGRDVMPLDPHIARPCEHGVRRQLGPVVADDHLRRTARSDQIAQLAHDTPGHAVRLMPPAYVKPYVKRGKTDAAYEEAICEAVTRPTMRFVAVKSVDQQAVLMLHKTRDLLVRQRTALINALRAHIAEYGIVAGKGPGGVTALVKLLHDEQEKLPTHARSALHAIGAQLRSLANEIDRLEAQILVCHRDDETSRRLATIPGIGPITASAIATAVPDASLFRSGHQFAAWLGITPRPHSSGGKERLGGISKQSNGYLRKVLVTAPPR